ncbi:MAG: DEAD/DEAH box helicase [Pseudomonadota bacterium]
MSHSQFAALGIEPPVADTLERIGFTIPTPIQAQSIPPLLEGKDLLGIAQTGTGKTAAFSLPLLQYLIDSPRKPVAGEPRALILAPTRELAIQIGAEIERFAADIDIKHTVIFGGVGQNPQVQALRNGLEILVATPGRLLDLAGQGHVDLGSVEVLILDEADRLLDMGFVRDVRRIIDQTPDSRQSLLFSATMPKEVAKLARDFLKKPVRVDVAPKEVTVKRITQRVLHVSDKEKQDALTQLLREPEVSRAIVFTRTKHGANKVAKKLNQAGIGAEAIHGNKSQNARTRALAAFKDGEIWVLVATDIAARGIDIDGISHVINQELPHEPESYVHRIGRTARAGADGVAWTLVGPEERSRLKAVERLIGFRVPLLDIEVVPQPNAPEPFVPPSQQVVNDQKQAEREARERRGNSKGNGRRRGGGGGDKNGNTASGDSGGGGRRRRRRGGKPGGTNGNTTAASGNRTQSGGEGQGGGRRRRRGKPRAA